MTRKRRERRARAERERVHVVELAVFLFLIVPSLSLSLVAGGSSGEAFGLVAIVTILRDLALLSLVLFFLWEKREPWSRLGWTARRAGREALVGAVLYPPIAIAAGLLAILLRGAGLSSPSLPHEFAPPPGALHAALAVLLTVVVAVAEETIFRGYLLLRLEETTRSATAAIVISSVVFALGHGYEGASGLVTVGVLGIVLALLYRWRGSLVAPMVVHFLQDFIGLVVLPALATRHGG